MASVLITGAGGFLGTWMTQEFIAQGHTVRAADLAGPDLSRHEAMGAEAVAIDVLKRPPRASRSWSMRLASSISRHPPS